MGERLMIPKRYITQWRQEVPWHDEIQIEQDLLINKVLTEMYQNKTIKDNLTFRGGTALNKLFIQPPARYSEDIDLVQLHMGPIGKIINTLQDILKPLLGTPTVRRWQGRVTLVYRYETESEMKIPARLKIEINTNEHFHCRDILYKQLETRSDWFTDTIEIPTYHLNELAATKLKALYQRKKGRDLFDMELLLNQNDFDSTEVIQMFYHYLQQEKNHITRAMYEKNLYDKLNSDMFVKDTLPLLSRSISWNISNAYDVVKQNLISLLPGEPWKGE
jgi:predicted nucleotidyltransferase component of viral defense system